MNCFFRLVCPFVVLLAIAGCADQEEIRRYKVSKQPGTGSQFATVRSGEPARILAAILFDGDTSWFFKLTGSPDHAGSAIDGFRALLKSIRFDNGEPAWTLPDGWTETKSNGGIRFATLTVPAGDQSLELSVIPLPVTADREEWLLSNVNRWRVDQLALPKLAADQLETALESVAYDGGVAKLVDITGRKTESQMGSGGAPFAPFAGGASARPTAGPTPDNRPSSGPTSVAAPTMTTPEGWKPSTNDQFSLVAYDTPGGPRFTVTRLGGPFAKNLLQNVNRWRGQVGLEDLTADELTANVESVDINGESGSYVKAVGEAKTILGVSLVRGDLVWFFKLSGETAATEAEREHFEQLLQSIKFPSA